MRAMILAAGKGMRLRPLTERVPKPLLEVAGKPMIEHVLDLVARSGIREVVINLHHLGEQIRQHLGNGRALGLTIHYSVERTLLDTGGALAHARPFLDGQPFVVINADVYFEGTLRPLIDEHGERGGIVTMLVRSDRDATRRDDVRVDAHSRVWSILGLGPNKHRWQDLPRYFYASAMVCSPRLFDFIPEGICSLTRDVLPRVLAAGEPIYAVCHTGYWRVLDTPADLEAGRREIARRKEQAGNA